MFLSIEKESDAALKREVREEWGSRRERDGELLQKSERGRCGAVSLE